MTDAGWFGDAPERWDVVPLYGVASERKVSNKGLRESNLLSLSYGRIVRKDIDTNDGLLPASFETYQIVSPDDIVLRMTDLQNDQRSLRSALVTETGIITSAYLALALRGVDPRFMAYQFRAIDLMKVFYSMGGGLRQSIGFGDLKRLPVLRPASEEQRAIADYLDRETARIDAFIAKNEELIALLTERKRAILPRAIDRIAGESIKLRYLYSPSKQANCPGETVLSVYREHGVVVKSSRSDNFNVTPENLDRYLLVRPEDVVVNRMKAWQGSLGVASMTGIVSGDYEVLRPRGDALVPSYANHLLRSPKLIGEYAARSSGIRPSQWRLYWDQMGDIRVTVPPSDVQERVAREIEERMDAVAQGIEIAERGIELARERRGALISAAVTGKIDVGVAA